jgi:hypothetical protein
LTQVKRPQIAKLLKYSISSNAGCRARDWARHEGGEMALIDVDLTTDRQRTLR